MKQLSIFFTLLCFVTLCTGQTKDNGIDKDTTFNIFNDKNYFLTFKVFLEQSGEQPHFGSLILTHVVNGKTDILINDSLDFFMPLLQLKDFNNDKTNDILILNTSSARSVWTHYLYVVDNANHKLTRVKDFENINNPEYDSLTNIITSTSIYNKILYKFYRIEPGNNLIDLGHSFEGDLSEGDKNKYDKAIKSITEKGK